MFHTKVQIQDNSVQIKAARGYLLIYSLEIFMSVTTGQFLIGHTREEKLCSLIIPFCLGWLTPTIVFDFLRYQSRITIDSFGITAFSPLRGQNTLYWNEIQDYGVAADSQVPHTSQLYSLYFADSVLPGRKGEHKKFKGRYIRILIDERSYLLSGYSIFDVCKQYTGVEPFTADPRKL